jgi:hypothetical protein
VNRLAALVAAAILLGMACFSWRERRSTEQGHLWLTGSEGRTPGRLRRFIANLGWFFPTIIALAAGVMTLVWAITM